MKLISGVIFFITALALSKGASVTTLKRIANDQLVLNKLMENRLNSYTAPCFALYMPIMNDILEEFSSSFQLCGTNAEAAITELSDEAESNRTLLTSISENICSSMTECSALNDSLNFFDCYSSVGGNNVKTLYNLSENSTEIAADLRQQYQVIETDLLKCQNASERAYVESNADTTLALDYCLANGPPEIVTTTTEQSSSTTEAVEITTVQDSTSAAPVATESEALVETEDLSRSLNAAPKISKRSIWRGRSGRDIN